MVGDKQRAGCVGKEIHRIIPVECLPRGCIAAHLCHVTGDGDRRDPAILQPVLKICAGKTSRQCFLDYYIGMPTLDLIMEFPPMRPFPERGCLRCHIGMLDNNNRHAAVMGPVHRLEDIIEASGRVGHREFAGKILVLDIDDQQCFFHESSDIISGDAVIRFIVPYPSDTERPIPR